MALSVSVGRPVVPRHASVFEHKRSKSHIPSSCKISKSTKCTSEMEQNHLQRSSLLRGGVIGSLALSFGNSSMINRPVFAETVAENVVDGLTLEDTLELTLEVAEDRVYKLQRRLSGLYREELKTEKELQDAMANKAVVVARKAGPKPLIQEAIEVYPDTWEETIGQDRPTFVEFYAPWCPYCKRLDPIWKELPGEVAAKGSDVQIARLNADTYTEYMQMYDVSGFPTLIMFEKGRPVRLYQGRADKEPLKSFVVNKEWKNKT